MRSNPLFVAVVGATGLLGVSASASAGTVHDVNFEIEIIDGLFEGNTYFGMVSYNDENLIENGDLGPIGGTEYPEGLLSLDFEVEGYEFSMEDDTDYPDFPLAYFDGYDVSGLDFIANSTYVAGYGYVDVTIEGDEFYVTADDMQAYSTFEFNQIPGDFYEPEYLMYGIVTFSTGPSVVPTPAAVGTGMALLGLAALRRRRTA